MGACSHLLRLSHSAIVPWSQAQTDRTEEAMQRARILDERLSETAAALAHETERATANDELAAEVEAARGRVAYAEEAVAAANTQLGVAQLKAKSLADVEARRAELQKAHLEATEETQVVRQQLRELQRSHAGSTEGRIRFDIWMLVGSLSEVEADLARSALRCSTIAGAPSAARPSAPALSPRQTASGTAPAAAAASTGALSESSIA